MSHSTLLLYKCCGFTYSKSGDMALRKSSQYNALLVTVDTWRLRFYYFLYNSNLFDTILP